MEPDMGLNETEVSEMRLEAYSVVLSVTTLLLSTIGGGAANLTLITAILASKSIDKLSYALVLLLLVASLVLDLLWTPQEILHLLYFHYVGEHPTEHYKIFIHGQYLLLATVMAMSIVLVSVENIFRRWRHMGVVFRKVWSVSGCAVAVVLAVALATVYVTVSLSYETQMEYFVVVNEHSFRIRVAVLGIFPCLVLTVVLCMWFSAVVYKKHGNNELDCKSQIPQLLIRDPEGNPSEDESEDMPSVHAASPLPLLAINPAGGSNHDPPTIPISPRSKNMLGVNMTHILGRRRHTICQIGDSSSDFVSPAEKAKKYNYIRKFSVDISALQAQLENPKLFSGKAPFQSDSDLRKSRNNSVKSRLPLTPPVRQIEEKEEKDKSGEAKSENHQMLPLITVSDDEGGEKDVDKDEHNSDAGSENEEKTTLTFKLPVYDPEESHIPDNENLNSCDGSNSDTTLHFTKLVCLLSTSFCLCMLPLFLTEVLHNHLSTIAYTNTTMCTLALSTIQTIIYPQVIMCMDNVVHRAVHKHWIKLVHRCRCAGIGSEDEVEDNRTHMNTDTSQV